MNGQSDVKYILSTFKRKRLELKRVLYRNNFMGFEIKNGNTSC